MSLSVDLKFLQQISSRLLQFKRKGDFIYNFRCPICLDSKKSKTKARGFTYKDPKDRNNLHFKCHNCGISKPFGKFLKDFDSSIYKEYRLESFKEHKSKRSEIILPEIKPQPVTRFNRRDYNLGKKISDLPDGHFAKEYIRARLIPEKYWNILYYTDNFKTLVNSIVLENEFTLKDNDHRIVIPFYVNTKNGQKLIAIQGRALNESKLRYITIKIHKNWMKVYGLERVNLKEQFYVVEGPFDSLFIPNCIAAAGSDLPKLNVFEDHMTIVYDNEPRNKAIIKKMEQMIKAGFRICIWPNEMEEKDINDMVKAGRSPESIKDIIDNNTFVALRAKIRLSKWRKI